MKSRLMALVLGASAVAGFAQQPTALDVIRDLSRQVEKEVDAHNPTAAREGIYAALRYAQDNELEVTLETARELNALAELAIHVEACWHAEKFARMALARQEAVGGSDHVELAVGLAQMGDCAVLDGLDILAETYFQKALMLRENHFGSDNPEITETLVRLAEIAANQGRQREEISIRQRILQIHQRKSGEDSLETLSPLFGLAFAFSKDEQHTASINAYREVIRIAKGQSDSAPEAEDMIEFSTNNLALVYGRAGRWSESAKLHKEMLDIETKRFGPSHGLVVRRMSRLAEAYENDGREQIAAELRAEILAIEDKSESKDPE